jgi:integrase
MTTTQVYLQKRLLKGRKENGKRQVRYSIWWWDSKGKQCWQSTGTGDVAQAKAIRDRKFRELNFPSDEPASEEEPQPGPTWDDCRAALERAMKADNLRPSYISDSLLMLESVRQTFPAAVSPADVTPAMANEYKRRRSEQGMSPWTIKGDLATLRAVFGKWLGRECALLKPAANPFAAVKAPRCDDPEVRIVTMKERSEFYDWFRKRWNNWQLPMIYLDVADATGWRATEIASMEAADILEDGFVRVLAIKAKTRKQRYGCLAPILHAELRGCAADGWAFGRFSEELRRLLSVWSRRPNHAAKVKGFTPKRLVGWMQDEMKRFNAEKTEAAAKADPPAKWETFTLHDFRRTAITAMQMAGTPEKEASVIVGCTPEVMRKHYEQMEGQTIAKRALERRLAVAGPIVFDEQKPSRACAETARLNYEPLDHHGNDVQTVGA